MVGRTIGKYRVIEQIGRGGMGTVYKAIDETLDRRVAIKVLNADLIDQEAVERFRREAMTLAKLNHGRIGAIHELTRDGHDLLMVMEFLEGETFEKLIERGPMPIPRAVTLCAQVLDALQYAHAAGVVHRDLKPANVIVTPAGDIKVMDFGIARVQGSEHLTTNGFMVGTPAYMAPEQVRGEEVDPRMDLYAVTVVLYRMLTQRLPFAGDTAIAMIHSQLSNPPTPVRQFRADLPDWIVTILDRGLSKAPADRFQTAAEFRAALEGGLTGKMRLPELSGDGETIGPMLTPPAMQIPATTPSAVARASTAPSASNIPAVTPSSVAPSSATASSATPSSITSASGISSAIAPVTPSAVAASAAMTGTGTATIPPVTIPPPSKPEATVTLRAPHLATAGILLTLLVVGVVVLAVVALRRPTTMVVTPPESQPAETTAAATPSPSDSSAATAVPATGATPGSTQPAPPSTPGTPATSTSTAATAVAPASSGVPPGASATTPVAPKPSTTAAPAATGTTAARGTSATATGSPAATGTTAGARGGNATPPLGAGAAAATSASTASRGAPPATAAPAPVVPAAANAPAENFGDVKALVVDGTKSREVDALLSLEPGNLVVRSRADGSVLRTLPYTSVAAATYARAKRPGGQTVPGVAGVPDNIGGSGFLGGARHWLTLQTSTEFLIVRLEDRNVLRVLSSIEARTGAKVVRTQGD